MRHMISLIVMLGMLNIPAFGRNSKTSEQTGNDDLHLKVSVLADSLYDAVGLIERVDVDLEHMSHEVVQLRADVDRLKREKSRSILVTVSVSVLTSALVCLTVTTVSRR